MRTCYLALCLLSLASCAGTRRGERIFLKKQTTEIETSPVFSKAFTGFHLTDAETGQSLCAVNADRYFIPASNTKILTLATCLQVLGDSLPGLFWHQDEDGAEIVPIGDPTFLHPKFQAWQHLFRDMQKCSVVSVGTWFPVIAPLGPGWAWDDANDAYSAERGFFPMYGNTKRLYAVNADSLSVEPPFWRSFLAQHHYASYANETTPFRQLNDNQIEYWLHAPFPANAEFYVPVRNAINYLSDLLQDTLHRQVRWQGFPEKPWHITPLPLRYSVPVDTVYRRMMYESDNFVAEQLLLQASGMRVHFQYLQQDSVIRWMIDSVWAGAPTPPRWVDGSGLSRYNLVSPQFLTHVLRKLYREQSRERLFSLFPAGGVTGTVADWYRGPAGKPFVFAKTGSMSGVHCLSGYLVAKSGRVLIFSFMHNHFIGSNKAWKAEMQRFLLEIHDRF